MNKVLHNFKPGIKATLTLIVLAPILFYLGNWQLQRHGSKKLMELSLEQRIISPPISIEDIVDSNWEEIRYQPVAVTGKFINSNFLLDNQVYKGKAGYRVITPFISSKLGKLILIDRGWQQHQELTAIDDKVITITGVLHQISPGLILKPDQPQSSWPIIIQSVNYKYIADHLGQNTYSFLVKMEATQPGSLIQPDIYLGTPSDKHLAYALQWFSMLLALVIYYICISIKKGCDEIK